MNKKLWHSFAELWKDHGNYKLPLIYLLMLASLALRGSGSLSADAWLKSRWATSSTKRKTPCAATI